MSEQHAVVASMLYDVVVGAFGALFEELEISDQARTRMARKVANEMRASFSDPTMIDAQRLALMYTARAFKVPFGTLMD